MKKEDLTQTALDKLFSKIDALVERVEFLEAENASLKKELKKYTTPKNSNNSSLPPSKDENRLKPNQSLRKPSGKKPGGQSGRKGKTLLKSPIVDQVVILEPTYCNGCGNSLSHLPSFKEKSRQIVDIPPIKATYTEYQSFSKSCSCGCKTISDFPEYVKSPVSYGSKIEGLIAYFHSRQYLPFARMKEMFNEVFNIQISEGGIHCLLKRFANKAEPIYQEIKHRIANSPVIGTDETGVNINGKKHWYWTWQTPTFTYITHSKNRGFDTIDTNFSHGFKDSILVHDGWKAQLKTEALKHQTCIPHLLRRLNFLNELFDNPKWSTDFIELLQQALVLKKTMNEGDYSENEIRDSLLKQLEILLENPPDQNLKELYSFSKRMKREKDQLFTFLFHINVPADNNASERAIRNVKVKQKISGAFKKETYAQYFATIRSIIDTTIKNGQSVVEALCLIASMSVISLNTD